MVYTSLSLFTIGWSYPAFCNNTNIAYGYVIIKISKICWTCYLLNWLWTLYYATHRQNCRRTHFHSAIKKRNVARGITWISVNHTIYIFLHSLSSIFDSLSLVLQQNKFSCHCGCMHIYKLNMDRSYKQQYKCLYAITFLVSFQHTAEVDKDQWT